MIKPPLLIAGMLSLATCAGVLAEESLPLATLQIDVAPTRVWQALQHQMAAEGITPLHANHQRFEASLALPKTGEVNLDVAWDEVSGGTRLRWRPAAPASAAWMAQLATRAASEPRENYLCGGQDSNPADLPEASLSGTPTCGGGGGQLASALFELEKCGDYESALRILAACVKENHAGGLIRLAWFHENGLGVPQRPEQMTKYLRQAAKSTTPGYAESARVHYATALYFGIGIPVDRRSALQLFRQAANAGEADAIHFLAHGYSAAWRNPDGSFLKDPEWSSAQAGQRPAKEARP